MHRSAARNSSKISCGSMMSHDQQDRLIGLVAVARVDVAGKLGGLALQRAVGRQAWSGSAPRPGRRRICSSTPDGRQGRRRRRAGGRECLWCSRSARCRRRAVSVRRGRGAGEPPRGIPPPASDPPCRTGGHSIEIG